MLLLIFALPGFFDEDNQDATKRAVQLKMLDALIGPLAQNTWSHIDAVDLSGNTSLHSGAMVEDVLSMLIRHFRLIRNLNLCNTKMQRDTLASVTTLLCEHVSVTLSDGSVVFATALPSDGAFSSLVELQSDKCARILSSFFCPCLVKIGAIRDAKVGRMPLTLVSQPR